MNFMELIELRRSIRHFKSTAVEPEKVACLVEAALRAPSSRGLQPWEFILVDQIEILKKLSKAKPHGSGFLGDAPLGMVICANEEISDVWVEDCSIATIMVQLAAHSLGLGSCWIQIRQRQHQPDMSAETYIADVLKLPARLRVLAMLAIGYPEKEAAPHPKSTLPFTRVFFNEYGYSFFDWTNKK